MSMGPLDDDRPQLSLRVLDLEPLLEIVRSRLGMDLAWMSSFSDGRQVFESLSGESIAFGLAEGDSTDLAGSFCIRVADGRLPNIVQNAASNDVTSRLSVTSDVGIGSYIGVPMRTEEGAVRGMLCCISRAETSHLVDADVRTMEVFAGILEELLAQAHEVDPIERERQRARTEVLADLRGDRIGMVFQPIVHHGLVAPIGVEALCRVDGSVRRPDEWFQMARVAGLGIEAELAAIAAALDSLDQLPTELYMSLNASPDTIVDQRLFELLRGGDPTRVVVEITEHTGIDDYPAFVVRLDEFRELGVRFAIDDVGAGFSSFAHVLELRPEIIKVDRSIMTGLDHDLARRAIASAVVDIAQSFAATIVGEGIETTSELDAAIELGIDAGQGYLFQRPGRLRDVLETVTIPISV